MRKRSIERTFWIQMYYRLMYVCLPEEGVVHGIGHRAQQPLLKKVDEESAQLIGSKTVNGLHAPVIDIDFPCTLEHTKRSSV